MGFFIVRNEVLEAIEQNPSWAKRVKEARNVAELEQVLVEFCKLNGFKVVNMPPAEVTICN